MNGPAESTDCLRTLASEAGVQIRYTDNWNNIHEIGSQSARALLAALGLPAHDEAACRGSLKKLRESSWQRPLAPVSVLPENAEKALTITLPASQASRRLGWTLTLEDGELRQGSFMFSDLPLEDTAELDGRKVERRRLMLDLLPPLGYHRFSIFRADKRIAESWLLITPDRCYRPPALAGSARIWGISVQLYGLKSLRNWGIGDFTDLAELVKEASALGADIVGVNPLHAPFLAEPVRASPYSASSRFFLNPLYLDVEAVREYAESPEIRREVGSAPFQERLAALRSANLVDYPGVSACKLEVLKALYRHFREAHLGGDAAQPSSERGASFRAFQEREGGELENYAVFEALCEHFRKSGYEAPANWRAWPAAFRDPESTAVRAFREENREAVEFYQYLQWETERQLDAVVEECARHNMTAGLYFDLALGTAADGADIWSHQREFASGIELGAPPDAFNLKGQSWGLPPFDPHVLRESGYAQFIRTLRASMVYSGTLRVDHVLGFMRQFWIPHGLSPAEGAYVEYPVDDLMRILALESVRNRCMVVGEDLGTVPASLERYLSDFGILSYRLLYFEQDGQGRFRPPESYPARALVSVTTHDLPTLQGFWTGRDLEWRDELDLFPSGEMKRKALSERKRACKALLQAFRKAGTLPAAMGPKGHDMNTYSPAELAKAAYRYLARTPSLILMVQLEDILGETEQPNLPGTTDGHPNWQRKQPLSLSGMMRDAGVRDVARALNRERPPARDGTEKNETQGEKGGLKGP